MAERNLVEIQTQFKNTLFREIYKNTWLKKINGKKKKEKLWVVFCVHDDTEAFLETYVDNKIAVMHKPDWFVSLNNIQHISPTICPNEQEYEFVLTLNTEVVRLLAPTWDQMLDWVKSLREKLYELKILNVEENIYTKLPDKTALLPTRDPTSPLPPTPAAPTELTPGIELLESRNTNEIETSSNVFNFDTNPEITNSYYEHLFQLQNIPGPSTRQEGQQCNPPLQQPPQSYKTFREQQVFQLQKEMKHSSGVRLQLRRKDCISSIGLVDAFDAVCGFRVCGWKQKEHPLLYNALHIGDQFVTIDGVPVKTATEAHRILQSNNCGVYVNIIIRRIPHGQVYVIHREMEGQPLGIIQENNTAVIESVEENSLVTKYGLTSKARTCDGLSFTNWVLTEINGRPLNLFFKKNQVRDRLNSVGRDISILVQPLDLIKQLKKQLRSLKNYKDYILQ